MNKPIDMIGRSFGNWLVLERCGNLYGRPAFCVSVFLVELNKLLAAMR